MDRRTVLMLSGVSIMGMPFAPIVSRFNFEHKQPWQNWLRQLTDHCEIEASSGLFYPGTLPDQALDNTFSGFTKAVKKYYFYQKRQFCFTVWEKQHDKLGLLELAFPIWRRQENGDWQKLTCLSMFQLEALAEAGAALAEKGVTALENYLLPTGMSKTDVDTFTTDKGSVHIVTKVEENGVTTSILVKKGQQMEWEQELRSVHCLTCQV